MVTADSFDHGLGDIQKTEVKSPSILISTTDVTGAVNTRSQPIDLGNPPTDWFIVEMRVGGSDAFVRAGGSTKRALVSWTTPLDHIIVGGSQWASTSFSLAEMRIYTGSVTDAGHSDVVNALKTKWGIGPESAAVM